MTNVTLVRQKLQELLDKEIDPVYFPVQKGDRINIGSYSIAKIPNGYSIKSYKSNKVIAVTFSKTAAVAIAKNLSKKKDIIKKVMELDKIIQKNTIDCVFYKHTMKVTTNPIRYESTLYRYENSKEKSKQAKEKLNRFIL